ncbi:MAG: hypothetical protein IJ708_12900 [Clostridia bacterium]|nr:hypothetical protein [Clostridia bacterium]
MKTYEDIVNGYKKRQRDTVVDSIATGLTYVDEIAVDTGLLEEVGLMNELTTSVCAALPFVIIAATEGTKVILGKKPAKNATKDATARMVKTGAAIGMGTLVAGAAGFWAAIPATMGVRALFDRYKARSFEGLRVKSRISRLETLRAQLESYGTPCTGQEELPLSVMEAGELVKVY